MTDTAPDPTLEDLGELEQVFPVTRDELKAYQHLASSNFSAIDTAYGVLRDEIDELRRKPKLRARSGSAARANPDGIWMFRTVLAGMLLFVGSAFAASYNAQYQMAQYTQLQPGYWFLVPLFIEMPIVLLTLVMLVLRRRGDSTRLPWIVMTFLTLLASVINVSHVAIESGMLTFGDWIGATIMGAVPVLILVSSKEFARLAVEPTLTPAAASAPTAP